MYPNRNLWPNGNQEPLDERLQSMLDEVFCSKCCRQGHQDARSSVCPFNTRYLKKNLESPYQKPLPPLPPHNSHGPYLPHPPYPLQASAASYMLPVFNPLSINQGPSNHVNQDSVTIQYIKTTLDLHALIDSVFSRYNNEKHSVKS
ncbi:hypothetical protein K501DRAFT_280820 [Backusella circina FSU 941]|nr:hypothetical protein K501DRAFT_280820 [Backusella circina FSU 941]